MLCAHRLSTVRLCLLFLAAVLSSAVVLAPAASADPSRAAAAALPASGLFAPVVQSVSKHHSRRKPSSARRAECAAAARTEKTRKACAVEKGKGKGKGKATKPSVSPEAIVGPPPAEALALPAPESTPPAESPGGSDKQPVEPKPPAGAPKPPVQESKPPVEESKPPVEESKPPVEEEKAEEEKAKEEKLDAEKAKEKKAEEEKAKEEKAREVKATEEKAKAEKTKEESAAPFRFFSPTSFWNEELPAVAPLDPSSSVVVSAFVKEIVVAEEAKKGLPNINTTSWSVPVYTVPANQPMVKVTLEEPRWTVTLQSAWDEVPLPADAEPAAGTDKHLVVWQPSTDRLWEFWRLEQTLTGWQAAWGGAMQNASSDSGSYGPEAWPGARSNWGASATSLSIAGGLITLEDLERGVINHALAIGIPNPRGEVYASPAQRTDGWSTEPTTIPEGAHLRLEPGLDLAAMHLPKLTLMMAEAAQRYGIFVRDSGANVTFVGQDPIPTGANPYTGAHGYYEGKSAEQILAAFPWSHLQLLKMELHG